MSRNNAQKGEADTNIRDCLKSYGINSQDYDDLISALFLAAPKEPGAHDEVKLDRKESPISTTFVSRIFKGMSLTAEDRGAVYAVWVSRIDEEWGTKEVVGFAQLPWGQR